MVEFFFLNFSLLLITTQKSISEMKAISKLLVLVLKTGFKQYKMDIINNFLKPFMNINVNGYD